MPTSNGEIYTEQHTEGKFIKILHTQKLVFIFWSCLSTSSNSKTKYMTCMYAKSALNWCNKKYAGRTISRAIHCFQSWLSIHTLFSLQRHTWFSILQKVRVRLKTFQISNPMYLCPSLPWILYSVHTITIFTRNTYMNTMNHFFDQKKKCNC